MRPLSYQVENLTADLTLNKSLTFALNQKTRWSESHVSFEDCCIFRNCTFVHKKCHTHKYPDFWLALTTQKIWYPSPVSIQQTMEPPEAAPPDQVGGPCSPQFPTLPIASGYPGFCGCFLPPDLIHLFICSHGPFYMFGFKILTQILSASGLAPLCTSNPAYYWVNNAKRVL